MTRTYRLERDVKAHIKDLLTARGWKFWMGATHGYGISGASDFCVVRKGVFLAIEAKLNTQLTPVQKKFLQMIQQEDHFAFVVDAARIPVLEAWLDAFDRAILAQLERKPVPTRDGAIMLNAISELTKELMLSPEELQAMARKN